METTNKKVWIRGNAEHPEKVREALEKHGAKRCSVYCGYDRSIYRITNDGGVDEIPDCWVIDVITTHPDWTEIYIEPEYKFKVGDKVKHKNIDRVEIITELINPKGKPAYRTDASTLTEEQIELYEDPQIKTWEDYEAQADSEGLWGISVKGNVTQYTNHTQPPVGRCFATERDAKSALAMAKISQLMPYYGGAITDEEWNDEDIAAFAIKRVYDTILFDHFFEDYHFLAFHTKEQRDEFYANNRQLVHDYLMID